MGWGVLALHTNKTSSSTRSPRPLATIEEFQSSCGCKEATALTTCPCGSHGIQVSEIANPSFHLMFHFLFLLNPNHGSHKTCFVVTVSHAHLQQRRFVANFPFFSHCFLTNTVQARGAEMEFLFGFGMALGLRSYGFRI